MSNLKWAIDAEKQFSKKNQLLLTFHENDTLKKSLKNSSPAIKSVYCLDNVYVPKKRFLIEAEDAFYANLLKESLTKKVIDNGYCTVDFVRKHEIDQSTLYLDPCKLLVKNLPLNITDRDIKMLFPTSTKYEISGSNNASKTCIVKYKTTEEAVTAYLSTNNIMYKSNCIIVQFNRNDYTLNSEGAIEVNDNLLNEDELSDEEQQEAIQNNEETIFAEDITEDIHNESTINNFALINTSKTLRVKDLPMSITDKEILNLFPNCRHYKVTPDGNTKSVLLHFVLEAEATKCYNFVNKTNFNPYTLTVEYCHEQLEDLGDDIYPEVEVKNETEEKYVVVDEAQRNYDIKLVKSEISKYDYQKKENYQVDPYVLHVRNLPLNVQHEDFVKLYPTSTQYQIFHEVDAIPRTSSALISFNDVQTALRAYKTTRTSFFKSKFLSVKFKCDDLLINPLVKRKIDSVEAEPANFKLMKRNNDDCVVVGIVQGSTLNEDDIEVKSEEESEAEPDRYEYADIEDSSEIQGMFNEDVTDEEEECQELEASQTFLTQDEDEF